MHFLACLKVSKKTLLLGRSVIVAYDNLGVYVSIYVVYFTRRHLEMCLDFTRLTKCYFLELFTKKKSNNYFNTTIL